MRSYGSAEGTPRFVKIQNLLSHPDDINSDNEFTITHPEGIPSSVKSSGCHKIEGEGYVIGMA